MPDNKPNNSKPIYADEEPHTLPNAAPFIPGHEQWEALKEGRDPRTMPPPRDMLKIHGITIKELAPVMGYSSGHLQGVLSGRVNMPKGFLPRFYAAIDRFPEVRAQVNTPATPQSAAALGHHLPGVQAVEVRFTSFELQQISTAFPDIPQEQAIREAVLSCASNRLALNIHLKQAAEITENPRQA